MRHFFPVAAAGLVLGGILLAPAARAHGRFPGGNGIWFDPLRPSHVVVRTTFGLLDGDARSDAGAIDAKEPRQWRWLCSPAIGYDANNPLDPAIAFAGSALLVGDFDGLAVSTTMCDFPYAGGELAARYFVDLASVGSQASRVLALASNGKGQDLFDGRVFETLDGAKSWHAFGAALPSDFLALSLEVAGDGSRMYLSGKDGTAKGGYHAVVLRADDGGPWQRLEIAAIDPTSVLPYLRAVDPKNPDVVYLAGVLDNPPDRAETEYQSKDGGKTWAKYFERQELLPGFALEPNGKRVALGGDKSGTWLVDAATIGGATPAASQVNAVRVSCLRWDASGFYACGNAYVDNFVAGVSKDDGKTFTPLVTITSTCGPLECPAASAVGAQCTPLWAKEAAEIVAPKSCHPPPPEDPPPTAQSRCGYAPGGHAQGWLGLALAALILRRRR